MRNVISPYQDILNKKQELRDLKQRTDILENSDPTPANLAELEWIVSRAKAIEHYIKVKCDQYGVKA